MIYEVHKLLHCVFMYILHSIKTKVSIYELMSFGSKTSPNHQPSTTVLDSYYVEFVVVCCVWFSPNLVLRIITKHLHFGLIMVMYWLWFWVVFPEP